MRIINAGYKIVSQINGADILKSIEKQEVYNIKIKYCNIFSLIHTILLIEVPF